MKKVSKKFFMPCLFGLYALTIPQKSEAQSSSQVALGSGLTLTSDDDEYSFSISGTVQPFMSIASTSSNRDIALYPGLTIMRIQATALSEKVTLFTQMNFSDGSPLLDGFLSFRASKRTRFSVGQRPNVGNNREMQFYEDQLAFVNRSSISTTFSKSGREFGLQAIHHFTLGNVIVEPMWSVTSGDGRNSFGIDSRDVDLGGLKYAGRIDLYPLGEFSKGNDVGTTDLVGEESLKFVLGLSGSYNQGASDRVGEGHGEIFFYDASGKPAYPDFRKWSADVLMKYRGFSLLTEVVQTTATNLLELRTTPLPTSALMPTMISNYLVLGTGYHALAEYRKGDHWGVQGRYSIIYAEFEENAQSLIHTNATWTGGITYYLMGNDAKIHLEVGKTLDVLRTSQTVLQAVMQIRF
ncbi:MAG: hypothetical protein P8N56_00040 [Schleiferiaceae bacterium]|nr:hypothetical protein [Schleiferiaceae bacterium]